VIPTTILGGSGPRHVQCGLYRDQFGPWLRGQIQHAQQPKVLEQVLDVWEKSAHLTEAEFDQKLAEIEIATSTELNDIRFEWSQILDHPKSHAASEMRIDILGIVVTVAIVILWIVWMVVHK
jgi:hypothetical protein